MNALQVENVNVLKREYWTTLCTVKSGEQKHKEKTESIGNVTALIITALNETFPELKNCSEKQFMNFQDKVTQIIKRLN